MKSLQRRYTRIKEENQNLSSYMCFAKTVKGQSFQLETIEKWFNKLVEKDDYNRGIKKDLLRNLSKLTEEKTVVA